MFSKLPALSRLNKLGFTVRGLKAFVDNGKFVVVQSAEDDAMKFPGIWLRDNCQCADCFHHDSQSRKIDWTKFDTKVKVDSISADHETKKVNIKWSDDHNSSFEIDWLRKRNFSEGANTQYLSTFYRPTATHWSKDDFSNILETFEFNDVMKCDKSLQKWVEALAVKGVAILKNSPLQKGVVRQLAGRVGFIRRTTYGEEFIVEAKPGAQNVAYLSDTLPLHTDLPYYEYKPSVNILHCLVQSKSKGGGNLLSDGFHVADRMKSEFPDYYQRLIETEVEWNDIGSENGNAFHNIWRAPVICIDKAGSYTRINHSIPQRDSHFSVPLEHVIPWYEAYSKFVELIHEESVAFKTCPGDVLTFNNIRLLHGRTGYDDTKDNGRCIVGAYLDWDILYSKWRVLKNAHGAN